MTLIDTTQQALEAAMRGSMQRQTLLTNNLANVNTPGYQRQDVNFQGALQQAMKSGASLSQVTFTPTVQSGVTSADGNGVTSERESASLADNGLLYQELAGIAASREHMILSAIGTSAS